MTGRGDGDGGAGGGTPGADPRGHLVRIAGPDGRLRGVGFLADHQGTLLTSHEAVDDLPRLLLSTPDGRTLPVGAEHVLPLPALGLALVRTAHLAVPPLPLTVRERIDAGTYVRLPAGCWREARVLAATRAGYTPELPGACHLVDDTLELAIGTAGRDALRPGGGATGGPVRDARTGAVLGVLGTTLRAGRGDRGLAVPVRTPAPDPALADLLTRNAATVPAYGADLNLAGVLRLCDTVPAPEGPPPVERASTVEELDAFARSGRVLLALTGAPGSGRTTELAALAGRRHRGEAPAPTLWLRAADLRAGDDSVADVAHRALARAAVAAGIDPGGLGPDRVAGVAARAGRPLLLLLDGPEEPAATPLHRPAAWAGATAAWLRASGARLVIACREEYAEALIPPLAPADARALPLAAFTPEEARTARERHGIPEGALTDRDAAHPLALRLLAELRAAAPGAPTAGPLDRHQVFAAHLDLLCLRVARRLAGDRERSGTAVRRLAARVAGQVHVAARRALGTGQGQLDRPAFEALFPPGRAPARLGGGSGWASAVLAEGLLVRAGTCYRFAHDETADWLQGSHLDLDAALDVLVHRPRAAGPAAVPRHRVGPVVQALLLLGSRRGSRPLAFRLRELADALDLDPGCWWAARLLSRTLLAVPDARPYREELRFLAGRVVAWRRAGHAVPADLGPGFWTALPLPDAERFALLGDLVRADGPGGGERYLDAVALLLAADPAAVQPHLTGWFSDERPLPATPHATVATAAQALLHTHRRGALDGLTEALLASGHHRADELLAVLAEDEPAAACRAVDRWAYDDRPERRRAAAGLALRTAPHVRAPADRSRLRHAARALLARPADRTLHGGALALLVSDPETRAGHLEQALRLFAGGDPGLPPAALLPALTTHPGPVLTAFRARLRGGGPDTARTLRALADVTDPALVHRVAVLVRETAAPGPESAASLAAYVGRRLAQGPTARPELLPLVTGLLDTGSAPARAALAAVLAAPGAPAARPLRHELLELLLGREREPAVLAAVADAAAVGTAAGDTEDAAEARGLLHRVGPLCGRSSGDTARAAVPAPGAPLAIEGAAGTPRVPV